MSKIGQAISKGLKWVSGLSKKTKIISAIVSTTVVAGAGTGIAIANIHNHNYIPTVIESTCTEQGYTLYTCECGESYTDNYVEVADHTFGDWNIVKEATCSVIGSKEKICACGAKEIASIIYNENHNYLGTVSTEPTCGEDGIKTYVCADCNNSSYTEPIPATGDHNYVNHVTTEPTCVENGVKTYVCADCNNSSYTEPIPATGDHNYISQVTSEPTCAVKGVRTFTCSMCEDTYTEEIEKSTEHSYTGKTTTSATCVRAGVKTYTCSICSDTYTETINPTGEHYYSSSVTTAATCGKDGVRTYKCYTCNHSYTETIYATGNHSYSSSVTTEATCANPGVKTFTCSNCSHSYTQDIPKESHSIFFEGLCDICNEYVYIPQNTEGSGDQSYFYTLPEGIFIVSASYSGSGTFKLYVKSGTTKTYLIDETGTYSGSVLIVGPSNGFGVESSSGIWDIRTSLIPNDGTTNIAGFGDKISPYFELSAGSYTLSLNHSGSERFVVKLLNYSTGETTTLLNKTGSYNGKVAVSIANSGRYSMVVTADGNWTANWGRGDKTTYCSSTAESSSFIKLRDHILENGTYSTSNNSYTLFLNSDTSSGGTLYSYYAIYDCKANSITLMIDWNSEHSLSILLNQRLNGSYIWIYTDAEDYAIGGTLSAKSYTQTTSLTYSYSNISDSNLISTVRGMSSAMINLILMNTETTVKNLTGVSCSDIKFTQFISSISGGSSSGSSSSTNSYYTKVKNYITTNGTYSSSTGQYQANYFLDGSYYYSADYDTSSGKISLSIMIIYSSYSELLTIELNNSFSGTYNWTYYNSSDGKLMSGTVKASSFNSSTTLSYSTTNISSSLRSTYANRSSSMLRLLITSINYKLKPKTGVTASQMGFTSY